MNDALIDDWLQWLASGSTAASTLRQRRYLLRAFGRKHHLLEATTGDIQAYLAAHPGGPESKKSVVSTLRGFYKWAVASELIERDPTRLTRPITVRPGVPRPIPEADLAHALSTAEQETRLMLLLGAYAGLRRSEIASLHGRCITDIGLIITGKGNTIRRIPLHEAIRPHVSSADGWLFPSPVRQGQHVSPDYIADRVCRALPSPWTTHSLRHRFATQAYKASKDLRAVQALMGHASPTQTAAYVQVQDEALENAVQAVA